MTTTNETAPVPRFSTEEKIDRIEKACRLGFDTHEWADIRAGILDGSYQIFENADGSGLIITEILIAPRKKYLSVVVAAGELEAVLALVPMIDAHARMNDCSFIRTEGRRGWEKILPRNGWQHSGAVFTRQVGGAFNA